MSFHTPDLALRPAQPPGPRLALARLLNLRLSHLVAVVFGAAVCGALQLAGPPQIAIDTVATPQPQLVDLTGSLRFGPERDALGALRVYSATGRAVGVYVDDETPDQAAMIDKEWANGTPLIIAGIPPGRPHLRYAHALNAQEWYPYNSGYPVSSWGPLPRARAYILQQWFSFDGRPPTPRERQTLLREARRQHPALILGY